MMSLTQETITRNLQGYIEELLGAHHLLNCFQQTKHFGVTITAPKARPLHIQKNENFITVVQYARNDDELRPDPKVTFQLEKCGRWLPVNAQLANGGWTNCGDGSLPPNMKERSYIQALAERWTKQLEPMGYEQGEVSQLWGENE